MDSPSREGLNVCVRQQTPIGLDAELHCAPGELVALIGPSGSGKTTLLRCIAGLHHPQDGRIACNGVLWYDKAQGVALPPQRRRIGLVFQDYALFPHLTALHNITLALGHLPSSKRNQRASELLDKVHLSGLETRRPAQLSGGQRQRVAVARALAREPAVLLLDEPFSAVDQMTRRKLQRELAALRSEIQIPVVLVTHDLTEANALADRMYVLHRGRTLQHGTPSQVYRQPRDTTVARLMGHANIFNGKVRQRSEQDGTLPLDWEGLELKVSFNGRFEASANVSWMVPPSHIVLHRRDRPSRGESENPVSGRIIALTPLGDQALITMRTERPTGRIIEFTVSTHTARRNRLANNESLTVSLLTAGIHLMPP